MPATTTTTTTTSSSSSSSTNTTLRLRSAWCSSGAPRAVSARDPCVEPAHVYEALRVFGPEGMGGDHTDTADATVLIAHAILDCPRRRTSRSTSRCAGRARH